MKTIPQPAVITPSIIGLALLAAAIVFIGVSGKKVPLLSNVRVDIILLVILGMTICTQGGIGRIAATGQWSHPQAIIGYIQNDQQALLFIAILASLKVVNAVTHYLLSRS